MTTLSTLETMGPRALYGRMAEGHPVDPTWLADREFHGVALGNPRFVERLTWKTFKKVFRREDDGTLRGWNVAVEQRGVDGPWVDRRKAGARVTYGPYEVRPGDAYPGPFPFGLIIDYGRGGRGLDVQRLLRDPLVSLTHGRADLLLGYSYLAVGPLCLPTPTFFALLPGGPLTYDVPR